MIRGPRGSPSSFRGRLSPLSSDAGSGPRSAQRRLAAAGIFSAVVCVARGLHHAQCASCSPSFLPYTGIGVVIGEPTGGAFQSVPFNLSPKGLPESPVSGHLVTLAQEELARLARFQGLCNNSFSFHLPTQSPDFSNI